MGGDLRVREIWVSEHYWPELAAELVTAHAQRLARSGALSTVVLPGEQTAFGLHVAHTADDVHHVLQGLGLGHGAIGAGWLLEPSPGK